MAIGRSIRKLLVIKMVVEPGIIDSIGRMCVEDPACDIKCAKVCTKIGPKYRATSYVSSERYC